MVPDQNSLNPGRQHILAFYAKCACDALGEKVHHPCVKLRVVMPNFHEKRVDSIEPIALSVAPYDSHPYKVWHNAFTGCACMTANTEL